MEGVSLLGALRALEALEGDTDISPGPIPTSSAYFKKHLAIAQLNHTLSKVIENQQKEIEILHELLEVAKSRS